MEIIDDTNELNELIAEYSLIRVEKMAKEFPNLRVRKIEWHLDEWKEQSIRSRENKPKWPDSYDYVDKLGNYFDF